MPLTSISTFLLSIGLLVFLSGAVDTNNAFPRYTQSVAEKVFPHAFHDQTTPLRYLQSTNNTNGTALSWEISSGGEPEVVYEDIPNILVFYFISERKYDVVVTESDCETAVDDSLFDMTYNATQADEEGFLDVEVRLKVKQDEIENSNIWDAENSKFSFCLTTTLFTHDDIAVRRKREIFHVSVNFDMADFGLVIEVEGEEIEENDLSIDFAGEVTSYQCNPDTLNEIVNPPALGPGDLLNICIEETTNPGIIVGDVYSLILTQVGDTGISYVAIQDGSVANSQLTTVEIIDGIALCRVQLIDVFFISEDDITVSGSVSLAGEDIGRDNGETFTLNVDIGKPDKCGFFCVFGGFMNKFIGMFAGLMDNLPKPGE